MLHSLKEDKKEYKRVTLDSQILLFLWIGGLKNGEFPVKKQFMMMAIEWSHPENGPTCRNSLPQHGFWVCLIYLNISEKYQ